ncbi:MAG: GDSL-type esterase/lipase family protein [Paludibacteraceae bacterium]|nr:GDSL-type esterase/lipase family protein [Paludibacteraceae bacterium]
MKRHTELLFFSAVIAVLAVVCFFMPEDGIHVGNTTLRFPSITEVMTPAEKQRMSVDDLLAGREKSMKMQALPDSVIEARRKLMMAADSMRVRDSLLLADTINFYKTFFTENPSRFYLPDSSDVTYITDLISTIRRESRKGIVHIAHYGDSQIEGDRISCAIRKGLQDKFGGDGLGIVPTLQMIPSITLRQSVSDSISRFLVDGTLIQKTDHKRYGAIAQLSELNGTTTITFNSIAPSHKSFSKILLFYSTRSKGLKARLTADTLVYDAEDEPDKKFGMMEWNLPKSISSFKVRLEGSAELYGFSLTGAKGVAVTNIGLRGSSGTFFTRIDKTSFKYMHEALNTRLVLMEFGGNATPYMNTEKKLEGYYTSMDAQIKYVKQQLPKAKIILIGPADMAETVDGKLQTYSNLEGTIEMLQRVAKDNGVAYWDMYGVMGGKNSIISWVSHQPPLAAPDYIHFSRKGADKIAHIFLESLNVYDDYISFQSTLARQKKEQSKKRKRRLKEISSQIPVDASFADSITKR